MLAMMRQVFFPVGAGLRVTIERLYQENHRFGEFPLPIRRPQLRGELDPCRTLGSKHGLNVCLHSVCRGGGMAGDPPVGEVVVDASYACRAGGKVLEDGGGALLVLDDVPSENDPAFQDPEVLSELHELFAADAHELNEVNLDA